MKKFLDVMAEDIYDDIAKGERPIPTEFRKNFHYKKVLDAILKHIEKTGVLNFHSGKIFSLPLDKSDYNKIENFLMRKDPSKLLIIVTNHKDKPWNYDRILAYLIKEKNMGDIWRAGYNWPHEKFDYKKAFVFLMKNDKTGKFLFYAGEDWPSFGFDYVRAYKRLQELNSPYLDRVTKSWPVGTELTGEISKHIEKNATEFHKNVFKLKPDKDLKEDLNASTSLKDFKKMVKGSDITGYILWRFKDGIISQNEAIKEIEKLEKDTEKEYKKEGHKSPKWMVYSKYTSNPAKMLSTMGLWASVRPQYYPDFDYNKQLDELAKRKEMGSKNYIKMASQHWKGKAVLATQKLNELMKNNAKDIPTKPFRLKE
jgi:hypothetical protein